MNPIEKIKNKRLPIRSAVTKLITKIQNYIENNCDDVDNILELQDQLIEKELSLKQLNLEMEHLIVDASEFNAEINASEEYSEKIVSIKYKIKSYIKFHEGNLNVPNSTQVWSGQNRSQLSIKLPEIPLPMFSGKYEEWSNFKIKFNNIISTNPQLSSEQKLHYLKAALTSKVKNLETISDSFESLFKSLEERYENKCLIVETHIKAILNIAKLNNESRKEIVQRHNMCLNCLSDQHRVSKCKSKHSCSVCGFRHNTLLHRQQGKSANAPLIYSASPLQGQELNPNAEEFHSSQENTAASHPCTCRSKIVTLPTAVVWVLNRSTGSCIQARAVLDSGSMSNIVTQDFANRLGAPQNRVNFPISSLDGNKTIVKFLLNLMLLGYPDASEATYGAIVYMHCVKEDGTTTTKLIGSKSRVAPIKVISIPRLELSACVSTAGPISGKNSPLSTSI
ncbi:uncharacterized protein TNIN_421431 [Trichonephila inaurata madagascariensis]|uniref:Peptidase aspartic putative domain-containing protein n=1 Tax=Trichonephila inaurata madagascariensis TaxID=2747483 RepID=A0A8X6WZ60_9ARAC|nr:uncharacterized protein TNIN_421431 [Trichonephila inaurata madagascariensis]